MFSTIEGGEGTVKQEIKQYDSWVHAWEDGKNYPDALIYCMSSLYVGKTGEFSDKVEEIVEARFFDEKQELHIFWQDEQIKGCQVRDEEGDTIIKKEWDILEGKKKNSKMYVKQFIEYDEDGQAMITKTCLAKIREGEV